MALLVVVAAPAGTEAGTGHLLSSWMSRSPAIDGRIEVAEWNDATRVDTGTGITFRIGNDSRTLYLAVLDSADKSVDAWNTLDLVFDDEGGEAPVLDDGAWTNPSCHPTPGTGEGILSFTYPSVGFYGQLQDGFACGGQAISDRFAFQLASWAETLNYEIAIPLDGPAPLRASPGQRLAFTLRVHRDSNITTCLPICENDPVNFRNLILASGGCNTGPQEFGTPQPSGLPLDWTSVVSEGSGTGWIQSQLEHEPELCIGNSTGGSGSSACVATVAYTSANSRALLVMPVTVGSQSTVTVRFRASLVQGTPGVDFLAVTAKLEDSSFDEVFFWQEGHPGEEAEFQLDLESPPYLGNPPVELYFDHFTSAGGEEGGYAQVDDVELLCGPALFTDGFESGLSTHWSATAP